MARPNFTFYHPTNQGLGSALRFSVHPATVEEEGYITMCIAPQKTIGDGHTTFPTFDWDNAVTIGLDIVNISHFIQVFRGECESLNNDNGITIVCHGRRINLSMKHRFSPTSGYEIIVCDTLENGEGNGIEAETKTRRIVFFMRGVEALGLCECMTGALYLVGFGS